MTSHYNGSRKTEDLACPVCHVQIGEILFKDGRAYLRLGGWLVKQSEHHCVCGKVFYWYNDQYKPKIEHRRGKI